MAKVTYVDAGGLATTIDVAEGWSLMQAAVTNGVQGIVGECGGSCACATCHCYVDEARLAELPGPDDNELAMLDFAAADVRANSRLSCQIKASSRLLKKSDSGAKFVNKPDSKRVPPGIKIEPKCVFQQPARTNREPQAGLFVNNLSIFQKQPRDAAHQRGPLRQHSGVRCSPTYLPSPSYMSLWITQPPA